MSDAAHPADPRGANKPRKPGSDVPADPRKKTPEKPEPAMVVKPKSRDKKPAKSGHPGGADTDGSAASAHESKDGSREAVGLIGTKGDARSDSRDGTKTDSHDGAKTAHRQPKSDSKNASHHDVKSVSRTKAAAAATEDDRDDDDEAPSKAVSESAEAGVAAAEAEAADLPELPDLPDVAPDEDEKFHAMCAWLSAAALILAMICPFYFVGPLLYWLRYRRRSRFVAFHAKQGLWWSLLATVAIWGIGLAAGLVLGSLLGWEFTGLNLIALVPFQVTIIVWFSWIGLKALHGVKYQTPIIGRMAEAAPQKWV